MFYKKSKKNSKNIFSIQRELGALVSASVGIFLFCSLVSYNKFDQTLFYYATTQDGITNWCGAVGAQLAALLVYLCGAGAFFLVPLTVLPLLGIFSESWKFSMRQATVLLLMHVTAVSLMSLYGLDWMSPNPGGVIGWALKQRLILLFGEVGARLLLWIAAWSFVALTFRLQLLPVLQTCFLFCLKKIQAVAGACSNILPARRVLEESMLSEQSVDYSQSRSQVVAPTALDDTAVENDYVPQQQQVLPDYEKLAALQLRKERESIIILRWRIMRLPNTVLTKNMFVKNSPIQSMLAATKSENVFVLPEVSLFVEKSDETLSPDHQIDVQTKAEKVVEKLERFGLKGAVVDIKTGPVVTLYEYKPEIDSKISKIMALEDDLAMALTATSLRIIAPIPGKSAVGFEIANRERESVLYSQLMKHESFASSKARLPIILGVDATGSPVVEDLAGMPHLLVGGSTGSGKSVGLNVMLVSLLCKRTPDELKLILIDPKRLEFTPYADIPHLLFPIVTQPQKASGVLQWVVHEMEERYSTMAAEGVRNVQEFRKLPSQRQDGTQRRAMPYLVVIIDELADLMMVAGKDVETHIVRIAQMARAAGIHMIVATQRPSVDIVTGLIKVNFPSRVAFRVSSKIDSRTILDAPGAEKLLGKGDALFIHGSSPDVRRVHCPYVSDEEVESLAAYLRRQRAPEYIPLQEAISQAQTSAHPEFVDEMYEIIRDYVKTQDEISISLLQRQFRIGFNRSARIIEKLEQDGIVAAAQGSKPRRVIKPTQQQNI